MKTDENGTVHLSDEETKVFLENVGPVTFSLAPPAELPIELEQKQDAERRYQNIKTDLLQARFDYDKQIKVLNEKLYQQAVKYDADIRYYRRTLQINAILIASSIILSMLGIILR